MKWIDVSHVSSILHRSCLPVGTSPNRSPNFHRSSTLFFHAVFGVHTSTFLWNSLGSGFLFRVIRPTSVWPPLGNLDHVLQADLNQFLQVLKDVVLPKLGDFEGFSRSGLDNQGNFSFGLESFILWPQCAPYYGIFQDFGGFHVTLVTESPLSPEESCVLYTKLGLPIR